MTVRTWNKLVALTILLMALGCALAVSLCETPEAISAAMIWMTIGCPCMFGFVIPEDEL